MVRTLFSGSLLIVSLSFPYLAGAARAELAEEVNNIEIYRMASPGVVNISSVVIKYDFFYRPIPQEGTGSGVIIDEKGYIFTNNHVIQNAQTLEVTLADGSKRPASLVGIDPDNDLAVIKIDISDKKLTTIPMGSSKDLSVGQKVLAIGNPFGLGQSLTTGVISSLGRDIQTGTGAIIRNMVQTDAAINPGNSGGPLLNSRGEMIGINTAILSPTGGSVGVGFGIPVDTVRKVVPRLFSSKLSYYGIQPLVFFALVVLVLYLLWSRVAALKKTNLETK
ncbi:MAG: trypsin-like serine protease [Proteobacteria bacterium]|nr:trypsin-like serine protease [Pseudomonadota bacterium]